MTFSPHTFSWKYDVWRQCTIPCILIHAYFRGKIFKIRFHAWHYHAMFFLCMKLFAKDHILVELPKIRRFKCRQAEKAISHHLLLFLFSECPNSGASNSHSRLQSSTCWYVGKFTTRNCHIHVCVCVCVHTTNRIMCFKSTSKHLLGKE